MVKCPKCECNKIELSSSGLSDWYICSECKYTFHYTGQPYKK